MKFSKKIIASIAALGLIFTTCFSTGMNAKAATKSLVSITELDAQTGAVLSEGSLPTPITAQTLIPIFLGDEVILGCLDANGLFDAGVRLNTTGYFYGMTKTPNADNTIQVKEMIIGAENVYYSDYANCNGAYIYARYNVTPSSSINPDTAVCFNVDCPYDSTSDFACNINLEFDKLNNLSQVDYLYHGSDYSGSISYSLGCDNLGRCGTIQEMQNVNRPGYTYYDSRIYLISYSSDGLIESVSYSYSSEGCYSETIFKFNYQ